MKINLENASDEVQIQLIPLIDVIFCILTFFILAALQLTRQQAINVDLPRASTATLQTRQVFIVSIDVTGQVYIDQQAVNREELLQRMVGYRQLNPTGRMVLYAPRTAIYDDVVRVLDLMRSIGGDRVALATLPTTNNGTGNPGIPGTLPAPNTFNGNLQTTPFTAPPSPPAGQ